MDYASSKNKENSWFEKFGHKLPEISLHLTEEERESYRRQALEGHSCKYFQMGNRIICQEGENEHGKIIATDLMLVETRNGQPILQKHIISS